MRQEMQRQTQQRDHPCHGCPAVAIDHAIACPALGVIAAGRCKSIKTKPTNVAFDRLHGWAVTPNTRRTIGLRSAYWAHQYANYLPKKADAEGTLTLSVKRTRERSALAGKATRGRGAAFGSGHADNGA